MFVKKSVDWSQNFILTGVQNTRPTNAELSITQWVSGFVVCMHEKIQTKLVSRVRLFGKSDGRYIRLFVGIGQSMPCYSTDKCVSR